MEHLSRDTFIQDISPYVSRDTYAELMGYNLEEMIQELGESILEPNPSPASCGFKFTEDLFSKEE